MIAYIDIKVNAAHPNIPLAPLYAFAGSPSSVRVVGVPQRIGKWQIDAVSVTVALPDNSATTVPAVAVAGCWVATLPSSPVTGYCAAGLQVTASGVDENGNAVTGYCLGVGDVTILSRDVAATSDGTRYYLHYVAEQPSSPNPGDMCYIDGVLKWFNGTAWQLFTDVVAPSTDAATGKAADAKATGDALAGKRGVMDLGVRGAPTIVAGAAVGKFFVDGVECTFDSSRSVWKTGDDYEDCEIDIFDDSPLTYRIIDYANTSGDPPVVSSDLFVLSSAHGYAATVLGHEVVGYGGDALAKTSQVPTTPADIGAATAAQGAKADTAVQPAALAGAVRYDLVQTITLGQLQDRAVQKVALNAASTTLALPALTDLSGKVSDFGIDMVNAYAPEIDGTPTPTAASFQLAGTLGTDYNLVVPDGETWSDMTALAAGEMAQFYFTLSSFQIGNLPTWKVVKQVVELVPVPSAP